MIVFPAIDLRGGQVVRLRQGDPSAQTVYGTDPVAVARRWAAAGAEWLHIVNLDGAFGDPLGAEGDSAVSPNLRRLAEIRAAIELPIQFGGGVRSPAGVAQAINLGATRVVLGTAAVNDPGLVSDALTRFGAERVVIGIDARDGRVAIRGWQETSGLGALELAGRMRALGVAHAVYTDIARDGMLSGPNVDFTASLARESGLGLIASGGVGSIADVAALARRAQDGIEGVIIGQALYTGAVDLAQAIAVARGRVDSSQEMRGGYEPTGWTG